ncbi:MAG: peptidase S8 [Sphingobium sp.]|nr:MAG: peptidase S8 [Sphingobium sp.]
MGHRGNRFGSAVALLATCALAACGGGGGGGVASTPTPAPAPSPTPTPSPAPTPTPSATNYRTSEYSRSYGLDPANAIVAYQNGASGAGVTVGVIDSGIASGNAEFTGRISSASAAFAGNTSIADEDGHGTEVATILAAARNDQVVMGMAWGATIMALRTDTPGSCAARAANATESTCSHNTDAITQALDHARTNGARVVNISLGGDAAPANLLAAVSRATAAGVIIVVSAGNDAATTPDAFARSFADPSVSHGLVIIAASTTIGGSHSSFSNGAQGYETTTLSAVGEGLLTQDQNGTLYQVGGTSFSAPQIAGAAALLAQAFPNLTSAQIVQLLLSRATDAGASGADAVYGAGLLNVGAAFAPAGATSLAGTQTPVSLTLNGSLSTPMGDAGEMGSTSAVALDSYGRAYGVNLKPTLRANLPGLTLAPALQIRQHSVAVDAGPVTVAVSIAPGWGSGTGIGGSVETRDLMLSSTDAQRARALSGSILLRLGKATTVSFGFSQGAGSLGARVDGASEPAFLIAGATQGELGFDRVAGNAMALRQQVAPNVALTARAEQGRAWRTTRDPMLDAWERDGRDGYATVGIGAQGWTGPLTVSLGLTYLREEDTLLGARFAPSIGALSGRTLFLDSGMALEPGNGWRLAAAYRQGWTDGSGAPLRTGAWSIDGEKRGVVDPRDRLALRVSQPLRVEAGGLGLLLPTGYDYATATATYSRERLSLVPRGREVTAETVYSAPFGAGWLTANAYWRRQSGNLAWYPDDLGGAVRFSMDF